MPKKLPACDPCRAAKLACDHSQPVCARCRTRNKASACSYRLRPFKKSRKLSTPDNEQDATTQQRDTITPEHLPTLEGFIVKPNRYPNPGYLGSSSSTTLFGHLSRRDDAGSARVSQPGRYSSAENLVDNMNISYGARLIEQIVSTIDLATCITLVNTWIDRRTNLALAEPFTKRCVQTVQTLFSDHAGRLDSNEVSKHLFHHSCRPLTVDSNASLDEFCANFCEDSARWETLGLFFTALSRAETDNSHLDNFTRSGKRSREMQRRSMHFADLCLEISLSLDCLNDLQLILQYENFINHSIVDGDQSYHSWNKLGNVASSLTALGYHQQTEIDTSVPKFLLNIRRAVFARAYSADKNVAIFLGRPPRICRKHCRFVLPGFSNLVFIGRMSHSLPLPCWPEHQEFTYVADTQWSAICAVMKEDIQDLLSSDNQEERHRKAAVIQADADAQWLAFPPHFRLEGPLKFCDQHPIERDFMISSRLNYLHALFLLRLALANNKPESDVRLVSISAEILALVTEAVLHKNYLINSGTTLIWKVAYYGLAAAGVLCLWLVNDLFTDETYGVSVSKVFQNLNVLVAEMESGTLVEPEDPNYELLAKATKTIENLLNRLLLNSLSARTNLSTGLAMQDSVGRNRWGSPGLYDFEADFWLNLSEHPFLVGSENMPLSSA